MMATAIMDGDNDFNSAFSIDAGSIQQLNDGALQQIDQIDAAAVGIHDLNGLPLPSNPAVVERLLQLHNLGTYTRLSWSRQGHIASVSEDGEQIDLHCLVFDRRKRKWLLSPKSTENVKLGPLASLAWSPMATDIAVVDLQGRLSILRPMGTAANRLTEVRSGSLDQVKELGQAIGLHWLSQDRPDKSRQIVQNTTKRDHGRWVHDLVKAMPLLPVFQRAVIVVNRAAELSVVYEKPNGSFAKASCPLPVQPDTVFTHATFSPTLEGRLLVALHSREGNVSAFNVTIKFPSSPDASAQATLDAQLACSRLPSLDSAPLDSQSFNPESQYLTTFGIIPTTEITEKVTRLPPVVYGIYVNLNRTVGAGEPGFISSSTVRRWSLSPAQQTLHQVFKDLPTKGPPGPLPWTTSIQSLPDKDDNAITTAAVLENSQGLFVTTQDGRTDFWSTDDLTPLAFAGSEATVSSFAQSGFTFPTLNDPSVVALSTNACCAATLSPSHKIELATLTYHPPDQTQELDPMSPAADSAVAMTVLAFARSCWTNSNIDDLLSATTHTFPPTMATPLIIALYHTLFREGEFMHEKDARSELEKVVQKPVLTRVFSFHYSISFLSIKDAPPTTPAPLAGQWVWIAANLRFVAQLLYVSIREVQSHDKEPSAELVEMVCGNIRWTLDLVRYIATSIFEVSDRETNPEFFDPPAQGQVVDGSQGLVALLLNCHWSRQFFIAIVRAMRVLCKLPEPRTPQQAEIYQTILAWSQGKGLNLAATEMLLDPRWSGWADNELDGDLAKISARQIRMMATGVVEGGFQGTVKRVLHKLFNVKGGMRDKGAVDRLKLWNEKVDLGWVLLDDQWDGVKSGGKARVFDVHKKKVITKGVREVGQGRPEDEMIKRCARCGRHNEDVNGMGKEFPRNIAGLMMRCVCDGPWLVEPFSQAVR
jgi:hypothetical protein